MAYEPDVILLDEPFSALDAYLRERMLTELMEILSDYEGTVIMVSHSRDEIYSFSEEVLVIEDGHGIRLGPVKEVFNAPRYKTAARLTGCKNIADVYRMDAQTVYVKDWDVQLIFKGRSVPENVKAIGIRAHDLIPVYGTLSNASRDVRTSAGLSKERFLPLWKKKECRMHSHFRKKKCCSLKDSVADAIMDK